MNFCLIDNQVWWKEIQIQIKIHNSDYEKNSQKHFNSVSKLSNTVILK